MLGNELKKEDQRVGFNSLRDFYLDEYKGDTVSGVTEADAYVSDLVKNMEEGDLVNRLRNGDIHVVFINNFTIGDKIKDSYSELPGISFRAIPVEMNLGLVYFYINRDSGYLKSSLISADLDGMNKIIKESNLKKEYIRPWMECRILDKVICVKEISEIVSNPELVKAFQCYHRHFNSKDYSNWKKEFNVELKIRKGHRYLLSRIIRSIVNNNKRRVGGNRET